MQDLIIPAIVAVVLPATIYLLFFTKSTWLDRPLKPVHSLGIFSSIGAMAGGIVIFIVMGAAILFALRWIVQFILH